MSDERGQQKYLGVVSSTVLALVVFFASTHDVVAQNEPVPVAEGAKADAPKSIPREPMEVLLALGVFVYPLGITSVIVVWFSIERLVVLRSSRSPPLSRNRERTARSTARSCAASCSTIPAP